jgi:4-hydroxy-4-methyl-2-oxoglutarate aldolase
MTEVRAMGTPGVSPDELAELAQLGAATLGESGARRMHQRLRPTYPAARVAGPAYPVQCTPGDNLAVHVAVTRAPAGSVLVVNVGRVAGRGYWGEVLTTAAEARGLAGLVLDGGVRDVSALAAHGFGVFSATVALPGATKDQPGSVGRPVRCGEIEVGLGDLVVGDADGVAVIDATQVSSVLVAARTRAAKENEYFAALRAGATTVELLDLNASLIDEG